MEARTAILNSGALYRNLPAYDARLEYWLDTLGKARFATFIKGGVAARLMDEDFHARLLYWLDTLGVERFPSFMSDCLARNLTDASLGRCLESWFAVLRDDGDWDHNVFVGVFGNDSAIRRLAERPKELGGRVQEVYQELKQNTPAQNPSRKAPKVSQ